MYCLLVGRGLSLLTERLTDRDYRPYSVRLTDLTVTRLSLQFFNLRSYIKLVYRFANLSHWVATLVVAAGDLGTREKVLSKLIELADILSDKLGNLISFMAVMEGLALPQVSV